MARPTYPNLRLLAIVGALALAACGLALMTSHKPAEAAFPGGNGKIAFTSDRGQPHSFFSEIFSVNPDGMGLTQLTDHDCCLVDNDPAYSPDGKRIAYLTSDGSNFEIYTVPASGGTPFQLTNTTASHQNPTNPAYSPDGKTIAYYASDSDFDSDIFTMPAGGGTPTNLTDNETQELDPAYSPDGTKLAFRAAIEPGVFKECCEIFTMPADGGVPVRVTHVTNGATNDFVSSGPDYSPDGERIAYTIYDGNDDEIFTIPAGGGTPVQLTNNDRGEGGPVYSPDGTRIAFNGDTNPPVGTGNSEIFTIPSDGGPRFNVTQNPSDDFNPTWQPISAPKDPTSKADCKSGGYKEFGFRNQGRCIAFVNRAASNR